jgi:hypothetical protein
MTRFTFIAALFLSLAACHGCGDASSDTDGSASISDSGANNDAGSND